MFSLLPRYEAGVHVEVARAGIGYVVDIRAEPQRPMVLHWAVDEWQLAPEQAWPPNSQQATTPLQTPDKDLHPMHGPACPACACLRWAGFHRIA